MAREEWIRSSKSVHTKVIVRSHFIQIYPTLESIERDYTEYDTPLCKECGESCQLISLKFNCGEGIYYLLSKVLLETDVYFQLSMSITLGPIVQW